MHPTSCVVSTVSSEEIALDVVSSPDCRLFHIWNSKKKVAVIKSHEVGVVQLKFSQSIIFDKVASLLSISEDWYCMLR